MPLPHKPQFATRRAFLKNGSLFLLGTQTLGRAGEEGARGVVRAGLITDLHYAEKPAHGTRHYRETLSKLAEAGERFEKERPDFVVELGDIIDAADSVELERSWLERVNRDFTALPGEKHYVLGNHCVQTLTKEEFLGTVGRTSSWYSFDGGGIHFIVLDSCFRSDGEPYGRNNFEWTDANIPAAQLEWLSSDLEQTPGRAVVFAHQRLDVSGNHGVKNGAAARRILEDSGKVLAVFQGHSHKNDYQEIGGIHYCTLVAMVEGSGVGNNGYSILDIFEDGAIRIGGYRQQADRQWPGQTS